MLRSLRNSLASFVGALGVRVHRRRDLQIAVATLPGLDHDGGQVSFCKVHPRQLGVGTAGAPRISNDGDIDIWVIPAKVMSSLLTVRTGLSATELLRADQIKHQPHRIRYFAVRAVLRHALSHRVQNTVESGRWQFHANDHGRPELRPGQADCSFSITHAEGFSVIAIATNSTVGIDAERLDDSRVKHLPLDCLSSNEKSRLKVRSRAGRFADFFRLWTLKEAYVKALGLGVSHDFSSIDFCPDTAVLRNETKSENSVNPALFGILNLEYLEQKYLLTICMLGSCLGKIGKSRKSFYIVGGH